MIFLAEITSYNPAISSVVTWRFASGTGYDNAGMYYKPHIENPATFSLSMSGSQGGRASQSYGELTLVNIDGALDDMATHYFDGRTLTLKKGDQNAAYGTFQTVLVATIDSVAFERERISVRLKDRSATLETPFSTAKYGGTNALPLGIDGTPDDLKDQYKPRIFGRIALMQPVVVNTSKLIYQVNASAVGAIVNIYDAGAYLSQGPDYSSQNDMETNSPGAGIWRSCPPLGCFRLGATPYGQVSCNVTESWAYTNNTAAGLIQRILSSAGLTSADWVAADFTALDNRNAGSLGIVVEGGETTASLIDRICQSVGAWWGFDNLNRFRIARFEAPTGSAVATFTDTDILEIERQPEEQKPIWSLTLKFDKSYAVQDRKSLAGVVPEDRASWFASETRDQKTENSGLKTSRLLAEEKSVDTLLNSPVIAKAEAQRQYALYAVRRDVITVTVADPLTRFGTINLGSVVQITSTKFGYDSGRLFIVISLRVDTQSNQLDLTLWG